MTSFHLYLYGPFRGPIETSFEKAAERLQRLPRLHFEPDGSFVWIPEPGKQQIFGMVYDAAGKVRYCDLQGHCDCQTWKELCQAITGDQSSDLEVMILPEQQLQDLQSFETNFWPPNESVEN